MKVIQFVPTLESGGVEQGVLEISKALVDAGHESHVVSAGGRLVDQLINEGTYHHHWELHKKNIFTIGQVKPLARWIEKMKADILHVRSRMPAWIVWKALNKIPEQKRPKLVSTIHGLYSVNFYSAVMSKPENIIRGRAKPRSNTQITEKMQNIVVKNKKFSFLYFKIMSLFNLINS